MIQRHMIEWIVKKQIYKLFEGMRGSEFKYCMDKKRFDKFVGLLTMRLNDLDRHGFVKSGFAMQQFARQGAAYYVRAQIKVYKGQAPDKQVSTLTGEQFAQKAVRLASEGFAAKGKKE